MITITVTKVIEYQFLMNIFKHKVEYDLVIDDSSKYDYIVNTDNGDMIEVIKNYDNLIKIV